jgi:hypothetical protein
MKFEFSEFHRNIPDQEILSDLQRIYKTLSEKNRKMTFRSYSESGKYSSSTIAVRFGSWNKALEAAGITVNEEKMVTDENLFKNIEDVWIMKGSQPVSRDINEAPSKYSASLYSVRFGSWNNALRLFVTYVNQEEKENDEVEAVSQTSTTDSMNILPVKHKTSRNISDRMRFRVLMRDGFSCQSCGKSPSQERGVELHVDHILPWSKGGETLEENLQTKCSKCNLGKGNAFNA